MSPKTTNPIEADSLTELHVLELKISELLRRGVYLSGGTLLVGWIGMLIQGRESLSDFKEYSSQSLMETLEWILVTQDLSQMITLLGLAILVLLPLVRVFLTGYLFLRQKDKPMALIAFGVLLALAASFVLGVEL